MIPVDTSKFAFFVDVLRVATDFTSNVGIEEFSSCDK